MKSNTLLSKIGRLTEGRRVAMQERARRGLPTSSKVLMSHKLVRDEKGRAVRLEVNEEYRDLFDNLATLFLEGVSWGNLEYELFHRYGHVNGRGEPWHLNRMYSLVMNPTFWGHSAQYHLQDGKKGRPPSVGDWVLEAGHEIPPGVVIHYNTHEPVYVGAIADAIKTEFRRRQSLIGQRRQYSTHRFSGLVMCGECGYYLITMISGNAVYLRCMSHYKRSVTRPDCSQRLGINENRVQEWLHLRLDQIWDDSDWIPLLDHLNAKSDTQSDQHERQRAAQDIARIGLDAFWKLSTIQQHQYLNSLMGNRRLVVLSGEIAGISVKPTRERRSEVNHDS